MRAKKLSKTQVTYSEKAIFVTLRPYWKLFCGLVIFGLIISLTFYGGFTARYRLQQFFNFPRQSIGTLNRYSNEGALIYSAAFGIVFATYGLGYRLIKHTMRQKQLGAAHNAGLLTVVIGFGLAFNLILRRSLTNYRTLWGIYSRLTTHYS